MMNKTQSLKNFVYLVGLHIYYNMIHGPYSIKLIFKVLQIPNFPEGRVSSSGFNSRTNHESYMPHAPESD